MTVVFFITFSPIHQVFLFFGAFPKVDLQWFVPNANDKKKNCTPLGSVRIFQQNNINIV